MNSKRIAKYNLTCPKCKYEFQYNMKYHDEKIAELGSEIFKIQKQLAENTCTNSEWRKNATKALTIKLQQIHELKQFRKLANENLKKQELEVFAQLVKEVIPIDLYIKLHQQAEKMLSGKLYETAIQKYSNIAEQME